MNRLWKTIQIYGIVIFTLLICVKMGSNAVTTMSEIKTIERQHCVVIDPGHGGEDGGAVSRSGILESKFNLEIAQRLNDLMNLLGYDTKMTRTADISIYTKGETLSQKKISDLKERVKLISETDNAVLLSIHQNFYPDDRYSGAQTFFAKSKESEQLAKQLQVAFISFLNFNSNRQAKKSSGIYLMEHVQCPAVLIECGFLSNASDEAKLKDPEYQKKLCAVIAATTGQYLSNT